MCCFGRSETRPGNLLRLLLCLCAWDFCKPAQYELPQLAFVTLHSNGKPYCEVIRVKKSQMTQFVLVLYTQRHNFTQDENWKMRIVLCMMACCAQVDVASAHILWSLGFLVERAEMRASFVFLVFPLLAYFSHTLSKDCQDARAHKHTHTYQSVFRRHR